MFKTNSNYQRALNYIAETDLTKLPNGKTVIDGENLFVNIVDSDLKTTEQARLEAHNDYIDIQIPLSGAESFGVTPRSECKQQDGPFDSSCDIVFFDDPVTNVVEVPAGEMIVFGPETAHAPLIGTGRIHKAIFKVKVG